MRSALRPGQWLLPALAAGAGVGLADGVRAAVVVGADVPGAILAFLLSANDVPAGSQPLVSDKDVLAAIKYTSRPQ